MALIEGVGDEVTLLLGVLLGLAILLLAWVSTQTPEPAPVQTSESHESSPQSVTEDTPIPSSSASSDSPAEAPPLAAGSEQKRDGEEGVRNRGRDERNSLVLRLKFLNDTERTATVSPQDTVGHIKRTFFVGQESRVRLIYQGQLLQDDSATVSSLNLSHHSVLHCHISAPRGPGQQGAPQGGPEQVAVAVNIGGLMVPLLMLMLVVLWYCQVQYRQFFTAPATATLAGLTVLLSLVAFGVYRR